MHFLDNGGSLEALSEYMAHSSVTITEIYAEILQARAGKEYEGFALDIQLTV